MTWTNANGTNNVSGYEHNLNTFPVTWQATGNLAIAIVTNHSAGTEYCTGLSGSGSKVTWAQIGTTYDGSNSAQASWTGNIWIGTVTATGSETVTTSWNGSVPTYINTVAMEFHSTLGAWHLDTYTHLDNGSGTASWPSLTPAASGELYLGFAWNQGSAQIGSTTGYVYNNNSDNAANGMAFNLSCAQGTATFPVWGDTGQTYGLMLLMTEGGPPASASAALAEAAAAGSAPAGAIGGTGLLYPTGYNIISGSWVNPGNAEGSPDGLVATWTDGSAGTSATLELTYGSAVQSAVPGGATVNDVKAVIWHGETPASLVASATAQAYAGASARGSAQPLTVADVLHPDLAVFTGISYADLADFRVRVTVTRD